MPSSSLLARPDTLLGVCAALGQDFGFNPLFLRIGFAVLLLWNPAIVLAAYATLGIAVLASRLIAPPRRPAARIEGLPAGPVMADNDRKPLPLAA